jgi:hypothetical protein
MPKMENNRYKIFFDNSIGRYLTVFWITELKEAQSLLTVFKEMK